MITAVCKDSAEAKAMFNDLDAARVRFVEFCKSFGCDVGAASAERVVDLAAAFIVLGGDA